MSNLENIRSLYQSSAYHDILHDVNGVIFPFNPEWKNIGISVSGGADSALMSVLLCSIISQLESNTNVHIITNIRCWKTRPWQKQNSLNVFNWITNSFPNIQFKR